jgi:hypothetical protein
METKYYYCDECHERYPNQENLMEVPACADSDVGYGGCCYKNVCENGCKFVCSLCSYQTNNAEETYKISISALGLDIDMFDEEKLYENKDKLFICHNCSISSACPYDDSELCTSCIWYGISSEEWMRRYD